MRLSLGFKKKSNSIDDDPNSFPIADVLQLRQLPKSQRLQRTLKLFKGESSDNISKEMTKFIKEESQATEVLYLRMYGNIEEFEVIPSNPLHKILYSNKKFYGMPEAIYKRLPILLERSFTSTWKSLLSKQPDYLIIIPVTVVAGKVIFVMGTAVLAYHGPLPTNLLQEERTWHILLDYLNLTVPLLVNVKKSEEAETRYRRIIDVLEALARTERDIHTHGSCLQTMAVELSNLVGVNYVQILMVQQELVEEKMLQKSASVGRPTSQTNCPDKSCHEQEELKISPKNCVGYVATSGKPLRANQPSDLAKYGLTAKEIHSVGGCVVDNIMVVPVSDNLGEAPVIFELAGKKDGGFSYLDEELCVLFAKRASAIISSSLLLDYKKKSIRRHGIRNEVLANIGEVSVTKVKQMLDLTFQYSRRFRQQLMDFRFTMRIFPDHQSPGVILYMFIDLGFVNRWQMRKSTLIRFILSMQQGYRDIPYHNWKHACCVTHFVYLLLKKLELVKNGYLTELEALTVFISAICHDIDHRGRNNHFNLCTKSELYHLYKQEDSIMERHHIAVALSVLNSEDCNILQALSDEEYREMLDLIQWNILATDLAKYMHNRFEYFYTLSHFDSTSKIHRKNLSAIIMTCADLCDATKRWDANLYTVKTIFQEFFAQGDDEIALGLKPMEMMNRKLGHKIPDIEIQFIHHVVRPAYHALADLLPQTKVCLHTLDYFEDLWLVSTHVFDEHQNEDPLAILDMKEMKEESLKRRKAPHLQNLLEKHGIPALSIAHIGIKSGSQNSISSLNIELSGLDLPTTEEDFIKERVDYGGRASSNRRRSSIPLPPPIIHEKLSCCEMVRNWMCCYLCRHRGLVVARAVRKFQLEGEYLDERALEYEKINNIVEDTEETNPNALY